MEFLIISCYWGLFLTSPKHYFLPFFESLCRGERQQVEPDEQYKGEGRQKIFSPQYSFDLTIVRTKDHYFRLWAKRLKCFQNTGVVEGSDLRQKKKCYFFNINRPYNFFQLFSVLARVLIVKLYEKQCQSKSVSSIFWQNKQVITRLELCQRNLHDPIFGHFLVKIGQNV